MPGFLDTIAAGVETAFTLGSEFVVLGTYYKKSGNHDYDPVTDELIGENPDVIQNVRFLRSTIQVQEREASVVAVADAKYLVPGKDLRGHEPGENDYFQLETGERWNVMIGKPTPGDKLFILFVRRA